MGRASGQRSRSATTVTDRTCAYENAVKATVTLPAIGLTGMTAVTRTPSMVSSSVGPCTLVRNVLMRCWERTNRWNCPNLASTQKTGPSQTIEASRSREGRFPLVSPAVLRSRSRSVPSHGTLTGMAPTWFPSLVAVVVVRRETGTDTTSEATFSPPAARTARRASAAAVSRRSLTVACSR